MSHVRWTSKPGEGQIPPGCGQGTWKGLFMFEAGGAGCVGGGGNVFHLPCAGLTDSLMWLYAYIMFGA